MTLVSFTPLHIQFYFQYASIHLSISIPMGALLQIPRDYLCQCLYQKFPTDTGICFQNELPQDVPQCNVDYLELMATKTLQVQEKLLALLNYVERFKLGAWLMKRVIIRNELPTVVAEKTNNY